MPEFPSRRYLDGVLPIAWRRALDALPVGSVWDQDPESPAEGYRAERLASGRWRRTHKASGRAIEVDALRIARMHMFTDRPEDPRATLVPPPVAPRAAVAAAERLGPARTAALVGGSLSGASAWALAALVEAAA
jgi:hypothetical protein